MAQPDYNVTELDKKRMEIWGEEYSYDDMATRIRRCVSWLKRAEEAAANDEDDQDAIFIFLWIAFNAAYGNKIFFEKSKSKKHDKAHSQFKEYFTQLAKLDKEKRIHNAIWGKINNRMRVFMDNEYVFEPFWKSQHGSVSDEQWKGMHQARNKSFYHFLGKGSDTAEVLSFLFDRLYTLRNQLMHGGATCMGSLNRPQVRDGMNILAFLVPIFIDIMMDNSGEDWGELHYRPMPK
ncbi:MAG: HEPN domain-containing protein [Proteobacteria bacterium]|nr:HEPN domain-containing protein [Pseudomonadota bacterium]